MTPAPRRVTSATDSNENAINEVPNGHHIKELLYENYYYDVTEWIKKHPGGRVIEYYTHSGEDATIAIQQFHQRSTKRVMSIMKTLKRRPATEKEINRFSPRHKALTADFMKLYKDLLDEGMFKPCIPHVIYRLLEVICLAAFGLYLHNSPDFSWRFAGLLTLGLYFGRTGWVQHESGHYSFTGNPKVDRFIQQSFWGIGNGMAGSWWRSAHNRHHAMPQRMHRDVDLDTLPLIAFNSKVVKKPEQGQTFFVKYQSILFLSIDTLIVAFVWKFLLHPRHVYRKRVYTEMLFMPLNYIFAYYLGIGGYIFVVWLASMYLFGNFTLSHTHLPVTDESLHWVEFALLHTTNISENSWFCDWWMGYLNYQIEHHLFPTMPQFRHPQIVPRVKALAAKHNLPYRCISYYEGVVQSFSNLHHVAKELNTKN